MSSSVSTKSTVSGSSSTLSNFSFVYELCFIIKHNKQKQLINQMKKYARNNKEIDNHTYWDVLIKFNKSSPSFSLMNLLDKITKYLHNKDTNKGDEKMEATTVKDTIINRIYKAINTRFIKYRELEDLLTINPSEDTNNLLDKLFNPEYKLDILNDCKELTKVMNNYVDDYEDEDYKIKWSKKCNSKYCDKCGENIFEDCECDEEQIDELGAVYDELNNKIEEIKQLKEELEHKKIMCDYAFKRIEEERELGNKIKEEKMEIIREKIKEINELKSKYNKLEKELHINNKKCKKNGCFSCDQKNI